MRKRLALLASILALGLLLNGCSKCGWIWDDHRKPGACR
jgi:PBP1b-binding outer membrane lipoprotein LpoB